MMSEFTRYGAVTAKARAMFGKRLRREDYAKMAAMGSVPAVADYLRAHAHWGRAFGSAGELRRDQLEDILRRHSFAHFLRLFVYVGREDRFLLRYPVLTAEMDQIMRVMRLASSGDAEGHIFGLPEYFKKFSRIQYELLPSVKTYDDLLQAVGQTDFYQALRRLRPQEGGFPPYYMVETQMRRYYYRTLHAFLSGRKGKDGALLREAAGLRADWENITAIERILRYYPALIQDVFQYLLPAGAHLRPGEVRAMISLDSAGGLRGILKQTHYGPLLRGREEDSLEKIGQLCLMSFYRRHMAGGTPSVFMPVAYINLYQNELRNIIHTIEGARYGLPPEELERYLVSL